MMETSRPSPAVMLVCTLRALDALGKESLLMEVVCVEFFMGFLFGLER